MGDKDYRTSLSSPDFHTLLCPLYSVSGPPPSACIEFAVEFITTIVITQSECELNARSQVATVGYWSGDQKLNINLYSEWPR